MDRQILHFLLGRIGFEVAGDPEAEVEETVEQSVASTERPPKAPKEWRALKERANAGRWKTDYFRDDANLEKPYRMNGWMNRMVPLLGAHLRGDVDLASRLAFKYAEHKSIEKQVDTHNQVMFLRGYDPKYGVGEE